MPLSLRHLLQKFHRRPGFTTTLVWTPRILWRALCPGTLLRAFVRCSRVPVLLFVVIYPLRLAKFNLIVVGRLLLAFAMASVPGVRWKQVLIVCTKVELLPRLHGLVNQTLLSRL